MLFWVIAEITTVNPINDKKENITLPAGNQ